MRGLRRTLSYANVMATLALFFALTGASMAGVKYITASDTIPATSDLAESPYGNPLIAAGKVTSPKIADGAITTSKFDGSATAPNADKLDGIDSSQFLQGKVFYADVSRDGTVYASRGTSTTNARFVSGGYEVVFDQDVGSCAWLVSRAISFGVADFDQGIQLTAFGEKSLGRDAHAVEVVAQTVGGGFTDQAFSLVVVC